MHFWGFLFSYCMIYKKQTLFYMVKAAWLSVEDVGLWLANFLLLSTDDHFVDKVSALPRCGSTNQSNSAFHPYGIGLMSSNPCRPNYMDYVGGNH